jgi:formylglycine-generating enzyme required for sulfatase activity
MAGKIFISYRRDDSAGHAGRVHDRLEREFGANLLFMDVDAIPLGVNFIKVLRDEVAKCDVLLALIGPNWLNVRDEEGNRRLDNPSDYLRIEIATALQRDIPVIPILLDGARMPKASQLPEDLQELSVRNGLDVRHGSFRIDMDKLIGKLKERQTVTLPDPIPPAPSRDDGRVLVDATIVHNANGKWFLPGAGQNEWFKDHEAAPEMVVVPAGSFKMGSPEQEEGRHEDETPVPVTIARPFAVGKFAVTCDQWNASVDRPADRNNHPVINVIWDDAKAYAAWLSQKTGKTYRLLSEAEREYVTRAGTTTPFWWGSSISPKQANYNGGEYPQQLVPVDSFEANPWGLFNVHGNVWEWTEDCWNDSNQGNPGDGSARTSGDCTRRVVRGGSWVSNPQYLRAASRLRINAGIRDISVGFRLARTLSP